MNLCKGAVPSLVVGKSRSRSYSPWAGDCTYLFALLSENLHTQKFRAIMLARKEYGLELVGS